MKKAALIPALALLGALGCAIGPDYQRPEIEVPVEYRGKVTVQEAESLADLNWWQVFEDPVLLELIKTTLENNLDLEIAVARTEQAYRLSIATDSAFYPQASYGGTAGKQRAPVAVLGGATADFTNYAGALNFAWEIDVWGRIRRASESARAQLLASQDIQRAVLLTLVSDVATLYFALIELDDAQHIAQEAVAAFTDTLDLFTRKYEGGVASKLEVARAAAARAQATAGLPGIAIQIAATENQLSVLLGRPPGEIPRGIPLAQQHLPDLPSGLPSALLERRPDIRQAEQAVVASNAQIGVALGNFLPRVGLVAMWGGGAEGIANMASPSASVWNLAAELTGPIFQGGLLYAQYKSQQAAWQEAKANYELTALNAFAEVSSVLVERRLRIVQRRARETQVEQLDESVRLSLLRYNQGLANYFEVLQAQQDLYPAMFDLSKTRLEEQVSVIKLYRALGGSWQLGLDWLPDTPAVEATGIDWPMGSAAQSPADAPAD
ncbi:MAG: efflux transporter outer membrane subunit [Myxococcota bacterium]|nr:efflux transporter outer membrane subunit [Myxococcota bacterium]